MKHPSLFMIYLPILVKGTIDNALGPSVTGLTAPCPI